MRKTLVNLEAEEQAISNAFKEGMKCGDSMRRHLYNIKRHCLYEACDCKNFTEYTKLKRLPISPRQAYLLAANGEVEGYIENCSVLQFSDRALTELTQLRIEQDGKRTHDLDVRKVRRVSGECIKHHEKTGEPITAKLVKEKIEQCYGEKPADSIGKVLEREIARANKLKLSLEGLDQESIVDADDEYPGVVKRLAKAYSEVASYLREVLK